MSQTETRPGAADFLLASKKSDILELEHLLDMVQLVVATSDLVHALQRERGLSNLFVGSGGERCADRLQEMVDASGVAEEGWRCCLAEMDITTPGGPGVSRLYQRIARALHALDELEPVREAVVRLQLTPEAIIDGYSDLVRCLMAIVFEAADSAVDPDISRVLVAMFHLMLGKEWAGQERAVGGAGFARGEFSDSLVERLRHHIDNQERCFGVFADFADAASMQLWQGIQTGPGVAELERLRRLAFSSLHSSPVDSNLSDTWFAITTARIDAIKAVEDQLEEALKKLGEDKVTAARSDLDSHRVHLEALGHQPESSGLAIFYRNTSPAEASASEGMYDTGCASQQLGRSLIDLVRAQGQRLQTIGDELEEAREALAERKMIEKAKGMIMKYRGVSEEKAFRVLRQMAMNRNLKLGEVARAMLDMEEVLKSTSEKSPASEAP